MIVFVEGDLLQAQEQYIAQGVAEGNQEGLGTGLALEITKRWPDVQRKFKQHARTGRFKGGHIWITPPTKDRPGIIYMATQPDMYHATVPYLRRALRSLATWVHEADVASVALPKIGAGLGKLSWEDQVKPLFSEHLGAGPCRFVVYEVYHRQPEMDVTPSARGRENGRPRK